MAEAEVEETEETEETEEESSTGTSGKGTNDSVGQEALRRERRDRKAAEKSARDAIKELEDAKTAGASLLEQAKLEGKAEGKAEALATANQRLIEAEVLAAATGKLRVPEYALRLLDTSTIVVKDDGTMDRKAVVRMVDDLLKQDPSLAVSGGAGPLPGGGARPAGNAGTNPVDDFIRRSAGR